MMTFAESFGGFCVVHAPNVHPERKIHLEEQMDQLAIRQYSLIEAPIIALDNLRIAKLQDKRKIGQNVLSLMDARKLCIKEARRKGWSSVMIFEDDLLMRPGFHKQWAKIAVQVSQVSWDMLLLYRWYFVPILEWPTRIKLKKIRHSYCLHGFAIRESKFDAFLNIVLEVEQEGISLDTPLAYEHFARGGFDIYATTKNLLGQKGGFSSGLVNDRRLSTRMDEYRLGSLLNLNWYAKVLYAFILHIKGTR